MGQHFLLSAKARTLSLGAILRMTDDEAHARFQAIRFADTAVSRSARAASALWSMQWLLAAYGSAKSAATCLA